MSFETPGDNIPSQEKKTAENVGQKIYLVTVEQFNKLPNGTKLVCIDGGREFIKGVDIIDEDDTPGYMAFGFLEKDRPAGIDFSKNSVMEIWEKTPELNELIG